MEETTLLSRSLPVPTSAKAGKDEADKCVGGGSLIFIELDFWDQS